VTSLPVSNGTVEVEELFNLDANRTHVVKRYFDADGNQQRIEVHHPKGSPRDRCVLHRKATMADAYECVRTLGTERHP